MKKKIIGIIAAIAVITILIAQNTFAANSDVLSTSEITNSPETNAQRIIEKMQGSITESGGSEGVGYYKTPPLPPKYDYGIRIFKGMALDKSSMTVQQALLLKISSKYSDKIYFLIEDEIYKLKLIDVRNEDGAWIIRLSSNGNEFILFAYESNGMAMLSANFKNYLINFEPIYIPYIEPLPEPKPLGPCIREYSESPIGPIKTSKGNVVVGTAIPVTESKPEFWK